MFNFLKKIFSKKAAMPKDINLGFWADVQKPAVVLAPMADVTDSAFREVIAGCGKPDAIWTEFVSADGLFRGGYDKLIHDLKFSKDEHPIVAQFFTSDPVYMEKAARLAVELGFDAFDINMGCPTEVSKNKGVEAP